MLNKAILMGRLVRDPEMRRTQSNTAVASFTLAVERQPDKNGNKQTDFIDCVAWGRQAEFVCQWFTKGMLAVVVGQIQSRNWEDKHGNKGTSIEFNVDELQFGETKKAREASGNGAAPRRSAPAVPPNFDMNSNDFAEMDDDDSDVPF